MTASLLQDDLVEELKRLFIDFRLEGQEGERRGINIYSQSVPVQEAEEIPDTVTDEELEEGIYNAKEKEALFPYIIVRLTDGKVESVDGAQTVNVNLIIGVIDRARGNQGHKDVLNIMQDIYKRFSTCPLLADYYECVPPIEWALQDEPSFPYFFGGMALTFELSPIRREDPYI